MNKTILVRFAIAFAVIVMIVGLGFNLKTVQANPSRITAPDSCTTSTNSSTTSISYLTPGTATTTVTCNLQRISALAGGTDSIDSAIFAMQFHASSTALSELDWYFEYSQDGVDWYRANNFPTLGTTTTAVPQNFAWRQYSTSTVYSSNGFATSSLEKKFIPITTPTRWVRAVFTAPTGSNNIGVWAQFIGKAERL